MLIPRFVLGMFPVSLMVLSAGVAFGQPYPNKIIRIVAPTVGGGGDFVSRQIAPGISGPLGQQVIVENKANGILAAEAVSKASPDGYTLLIAGAQMYTAPLLTKTPYDAVKDFAPISLLVREVSVLVVHPSMPATSVKELIALAKARPGELNYSSSGTGSSAHLAAELFKSMAGINVVHVPYKGSAPALAALLGGEVQLTIADAGLVAPHVKAGNLKALAVTSATPSALTPGLPTVASSGVPGYEAVASTGVWAPAKTPAAIIARLNQEIVRVLNLPEVKEKFLNAGVEVVGSSSEQFTATINSEISKTAKVIKDAGIKAD